MGQDLFSARLLKWFDQHGRHDLPWQFDQSAYRVWVSEIMLQQTQVATVIPYYHRFMKRFPSIGILATASEDEVLQFWAGLGYYARGRNLHKTATIIVEQYHGQFPKTLPEVNALPGIGRSTAAAILALSDNQRHAILDGNVKRTLSRYHGIEGYPGDKVVGDALWALAEQHTPKKRVADYTQAIMDMGATLCTRSKPKCEICPVKKHCVAYRDDRISELPQRKPKKLRPHKQRTVLLLIDEHNQVLLLKRPSKGIWGGLYSLPEFESKDDCIDAVKTATPELVKGLQHGDPLSHKFTHYDLTLSPVHIFCQANDQKEYRKINNDEASVARCTLGDKTPDVGIPTPIQKILDRFQ